MTEYPIGPEDDGRLLRSYLQALGISSRTLSLLKQKENGITVNGEKVTVRYILKDGDRLRLDFSDPEGNDHITPTPLPLHILYEDDALIAVNKSGDMPTHPSHGHHGDTLANALAYYFAHRGEGAPFVFRPVNRLDRTTSGVVLLAKNRYAADALRQALSESGEKEYTAIVCGAPEPDSGLIDQNIRRTAESIIFRCTCPENEGKVARTEYTVIKRFSRSGKPLAVLSLHPLTGRTHQLRVHCRHMGAPICGDGLYGGDVYLPPEDMPKRTLLHASRLFFTHPFTKEKITFAAPLPEDFSAFLKACGVSAADIEEKTSRAAKSDG